MGFELKLEDLKGRWAKELQGVLWYCQTIRRGSTSETPYVLAFGLEAMVSVEIRLPSKRAERLFNEGQNNDVLLLNLDLLE